MSLLSRVKLGSLSKLRSSSGLTPALRLLHLSPRLSGGKEWRELKRQEKQRKDRAWISRKRANPFSRNVGLAGRMYHLEQDPDDAAFADPDPEPDVNPELHVEMLADSTEKSLNNMFGKKRNQESSPYAIMMNKRFRVKDPNLLTWTERKAIAHLHQSDPAEWTIKRLAESYPAKEKVIEMLARKKPTCGDSQKVIASVDQEVRDNWEKLAKGKLEVSEELAERLEQLQINPKDRLKQLDRVVSEEMSQMLLEQNKKLLEGPEVKVGEFGNIIRSYNLKVEAKRKALEQKQDSNIAVQSGDQIQAEIPAMFDPKTEFNVNMGNVPSPYRDTAMINVSDGNFKDKFMTQEQFKEERLKHKTFSGYISDKIQEESDLSKQYKQWLEEEFAKEEAVTKDPPKLTAEEVFQELPSLIEAPKMYEDDDIKSGSIQNTSGYNIKEDKIMISSDKHKKVAVYERNGSFYDEDGNFLYRIPVETMT